MSLECGGVRHLLNVIWESVPCRKSCIVKATFAKCDASLASDIYRCCGSADQHGIAECRSALAVTFVNKVRWCSFGMYFVHQQT